MENNQDISKKKPFYKKWWVWLLTFLFILILSSGGEVSEKEIVNQIDEPPIVENIIEEEIKTETVVAQETREEIKDVQEIAQVTPQPTETIEPQPQQTQYYTVTSVVDGDTIKISMNGTTETLRLIGMDTPETVDPRKPIQCFGMEASNKAKELLSGKQVRIETDSSQDTRDKYGRLLVYVYRLDGLFFNKYMIEQGYAYEYTYETPYTYQSDFKTAQQSAQANQKGLWSPTTCNGDPNTEVETESSTQEEPQVSSTSSGGKYYTSSHSSAKYYYPEACSAWQGLSETYLKSYNTLDELLAVHSRTLSPQCD